MSEPTYQMKTEENTQENTQETPDLEVYVRKVNDTTKRGRKALEVEWPSQAFTAGQVTKSLRGRMSRASVHSKLKKALEFGEVNIVRTEQPKMGRPITVYSTKKQDQETQLS